MKETKLILIIALIMTFINFGCGNQQPIAQSNQNTSQADSDGDGIPDSSDFADNQTSHEIPAIAEDGKVEYLDCSKTNDCNKNGIPDNEEYETTKKCGWSCVASNTRTYAMIGVALLGGYIAGQYIHWPFKGEKDTQGNPMNDIGLDDSDKKPIEWESSSLILVKPQTGAKITHMQLEVKGKCKNYTTGEKFPCGFGMRNQVDEIYPSTEPLPPTVTSPLKYSFDLRKSNPTYDKAYRQYVEVMKGSNTYSLTDPGWVGGKTIQQGGTEAIITASAPVTTGDNKQAYSKIKIEPKQKYDPNAVPNETNNTSSTQVVNKSSTNWQLIDFKDIAETKTTLYTYQISKNLD